MADERWIPARVVDRTVWDEGLWTFRLDLSRGFKSGQFTTLALERHGGLVKRAYSIASAPGAPLEFYVVVVEEGALTPGLWALQRGDEVLVRDRTAGLFTHDRLPAGGTLWLIGTGTGLAPYISMVREGSCFDRYAHVVVVHGVRHARQLGYRAELDGLAAVDPRFTYVKAITREEAPGCLKGRLPELLVSGALEASVGRPLAVGESQVMICGNPDMLELMLDRLGERGLYPHKPREPGHVHTERYW